MYILKGLVHSISKKKLSILLVWLQFSMIFFITFSLVDSYSKLYRNENEKRRNISADFDRACELKINTLNGEEKTFSAATDFLTEVKGLNDIEVLGNYFTNDATFFSLKENYAFVNASNKSLDQAKVLGSVSESDYIWRKKNLSTEILCVDIGLFSNLIPNKLIEGKRIDSTIFENDGYRPVIVGYGYKDAFSIGDTFKSDDGYYKCQVVGILDKNSKWLTESYGLPLEMEDIDNKLIVLVNRPGVYIRTEAEGNVLFNNYFITKKPFDSEIKSKICQIAEKYGFSVGVYSFNEFFKTCRENYFDRSFLTLFSILFLSAIAVFGLSSLIVYTISSSKREIGIRMACGAGAKHIMGIFCTEILIIINAAFVTSCIIMNSNILEILFKLSIGKINFEVYIWTFVIAVITCILSCIFPIRNIMKLKPSELTGGNQ